jgi:ATP-dependent protease ClpP protease subunit
MTTIEDKVKKEEVKKSKKITDKDTSNINHLFANKHIKNKENKALFSKTQIHIDKLVEKLDCPVLVYFKPPNGNIWSQDLYAIMECLKKIGHVEKLALYIRSDGGQGMVSLRIINLLRSFVKHLILLAPAECASAATMIALGCNEIYMGPISSLSPVDSSMVHSLAPVDKMGNKVSISFDELSRVLKLWNKEDHNRESLLEVLETKETEDIFSNFDNPYKHLFEYIHPLVFGAVDRHSSLSIRICHEILGFHITDEQKIKEITDHLNHDYPAHGYPITMLEAKKIGLPVKKLDDDVLQILNEMQHAYNEITEEQITDYDSFSYHDNTIYSVVEMQGMQLFYKHDYDKLYRETEKRYILVNDNSGWSQVSFDGKTENTQKKSVIINKLFI